MSFNPFKTSPSKLADNYMSWSEMSSKPYDMKSVNPFTKLWVILLNGSEFEAVGYLHRFSRSCPDNDVRRTLASIRRGEQQQQKALCALKPIGEDILVHTIAYEQLAVELTAVMARREPDKYVKQALDFALLEDFDHLYRYADLLEMDKGIKAETLVGRLTEIMPGRPTVSEHRSPPDDVKRYCNFTNADLLTKLQTNIITAAEQQTMNYYMNVGGFYDNKMGRDLYTEIAMIEEQHVTQYGSLLDTTCTFFENLVMHEYTECYLYYSAMRDEKDKRIADIYERFFNQELAHLHAATRLLNTYEHKEYQQVVGNGDFPELLAFTPNVEYIRDVLANTVNLTADRESYIDVCELPQDNDFADYQQTVNDKLKDVASHRVISKRLSNEGIDYRYEKEPHPVQALQDRQKDNVSIGRTDNC